MSNYSVADDELGVHAKTLAANTIDRVTFTRDTNRVRVLSDGATDLYFTVDGTVPEVGGNKTHRLPAGAIAALEVDVPAGSTEVKLISSGTPKYSVTEA